MDREIEVPANSAAWLKRAVQPWGQFFLKDTMAIVLPITVTCIFANITAYLYRRAVQKAEAEGKILDHKTDEMYQKRLLRADRLILAFSLFAAVQAGVIALTDAYISSIALSQDASEVEWTLALGLEIAAYLVAIVAVLVAAMVLVPLAQMVAIFYLLTRGRKNGDATPMSKYILQARRISTLICYTWSICAFTIATTWSPLDNTVVRDVLFNAAWGSCMWWIEASYAFNFRAQEIAEKRIAIGNAGVRKVVMLFGGTAQNVHDEEKGLLVPVDAQSEKAHLLPALVQIDEDVDLKTASIVET